MVHELTQGISQLRCFPSCCENKLTLVRLRVRRILPVRHRVSLLILAGGGDGPSSSSKSIRSQLSSVNMIVYKDILNAIRITKAFISNEKCFIGLMHLCQAGRRKVPNSRKFRRKAAEMSVRMGKIQSGPAETFNQGLLRIRDSYKEAASQRMSRTLRKQKIVVSLGQRKHINPFTHIHSCRKAQEQRKVVEKDWPQFLRNVPLRLKKERHYSFQQYFCADFLFCVLYSTGFPPLHPLKNCPCFWKQRSQRLEQKWRNISMKPSP